MTRRIRNLLTETTQIIESSGESINDVQWVGDKYIYFTWDEFVELAKDFNYDSGFGGNVVIGDLMVVGTDWWLSRGEYDGSEWWELHKKSAKPKQHIKPKHLKESWNHNHSIESPILRANFDSDEEVKQYLRENNIDSLLEEKSK